MESISPNLPEVQTEKEEIPADSQKTDFSTDQKLTNTIVTYCQTLEEILN